MKYTLSYFRTSQYDNWEEAEQLGGLRSVEVKTASIVKVNALVQLILQTADMMEHRAELGFVLRSKAGRTTSWHSRL